MKMNIEFSLDNDFFGDDEWGRDLAILRTLERIGAKIGKYGVVIGTQYSVVDGNGNTIGSYQIID